MPAIASKFCRVCDRKVAAYSTGPNHVLHVLLTLITLGLWLPVWIFMSCGSGHICPNCGTAIKGTSIFTMLAVIAIGMAVVFWLVLRR